MSICTGISYELKNLNNLFIEMTAKNCNQRCQKCYIDFPFKKNVKDFIPVDTIKKALKDTENENLYCIYLTGAEPMTHPDFNTILRMCLKRCNVCICTNGSFLNEKKIRFLKKVEDEGCDFQNDKFTPKFTPDFTPNQIFFRLSVAHYDEKMSDSVKYHGNYRQNIFALRLLNKYNFTSVLNVQNVFNLKENEIYDNFNRIFIENDITDTDIQISKSYPCSETDEIIQESKTDCLNGRILTINGVYSCPFLANDYRGRCGVTFADYSKIVNADSDFCLTCSANNKPVFGIG